MIWDLNCLLMIDLYGIEHQTGTSLIIEEPQKEPKPLVTLEQKEFFLGEEGYNFHPHLITYHEGRYKMWYQLSLKPYNPLQVGYAESTDGLSFKPVRVGLVEHKGSLDNNMVKVETRGYEGISLHGFLHDPLDHEYPFKCVYYRPGKGDSFDRGVAARHPKHRQRDWRLVWGIGRSRDGFNWEAPKHDHFLIGTQPEHAHLHRAFDGGFVFSDQMASPMGDWANRNVRGWITYDGETAHMIPDYVFQMPLHFILHHSDEGSPLWDNTCWVQPHMGIVPARKGDCMIGMHGLLYGATGTETFNQKSDIGLCISNGNGGVTFRETLPHLPFIRRGMKGSWDYGMVYQLAIVDTPEKTLFYYGGGAVGNFANPYLPGVAWVERDRLAYRMIHGHRHVNKEAMRGSFITKPIKLTQTPHLAINISHLSPEAEVKVALLDEHSGEIPGFGFDEACPVTQNGIRVPLQWTKGNLSDLAGKTVKFACTLAHSSCGVVYFDSPRVYGFYTDIN